MKRNEMAENTINEVAIFISGYHTQIIILLFEKGESSYAQKNGNRPITLIVNMKQNIMD